MTYESSFEEYTRLHLLYCMGDCVLLRVMLGEAARFARKALGMTRGLCGIGFLWAVFSVACSTGSGHPPGADAGTTGGSLAGGALGTGGSGGSDASTTPPACGTFKTTTAYSTATLHGTVWTDANPESTIAIYAAAAGAPVCAKGKIAKTSTGGYGYGILAFDVNAVLGTPSNADDDAGSATAITAWESYVPLGDGLIVELDNKTLSNLWLCLEGANFQQWCVQNLKSGAFFRWSDFDDEYGTGIHYANQPIVSIQLTMPDGTGDFDVCVNSLVEAASWCACPGGGCACPTGSNACNGTCVADTAINPLNCGTCGKVCSSTAVCREGECAESIFGEVGMPHSLANDASYVYFTQPDRGTVSRASLSGGIPEVIASGQSAPTHIVVADGIVYWLNAGTEAKSFADGSIMRMQRAVAPESLALGQNNAAALAADSRFIYWANAGTKSKLYTDGAVMKLDLAAGILATPVPLATSRVHPRGVAVDAVNIYWVEQGSGNWGSPTADGQVLKLALDASSGTLPTVLAKNLLAPMAITVDANSVYVGCSDSVLKIALGDAKATTLATGQSQVFALAVDSTDVYFTSVFAGSLVTVPIAGTASPVTLARGQNYAVGLALSETDVYFATQTETLRGGIQKTPK
jgi:hypothetical protein